MTPQSPRASARTLAGITVLMLAFLAAGWPFMKKLGIEVDEAMIGNGIFERASPSYSWHLFDREIPVMLMTYVGALKTWLYNPLFAIWPPSPLSLRLPMMLVGAFTIVLFFVLLDRSLGRRAAWVGSALLATDPSFVLTESIDLGFVALQHAFKLGAVLLLMFYHRRSTPLRLAAPFFILGIAVWDKAVFLWVLAAIVCAGAAVFWPEVRAHLSLRNLGIGALAFGFGALPFIAYNIEHPFETFRENAHLTPDNPAIKLTLAKRTLDGSGLFGFLTAPDPGPSPGQAHSLTQRAAFSLSNLFGAPTTDWMGCAFLVSLAAVPFLWRIPGRRMLAFAILFVALTWLQMFFTTGAGGAVHHLILLWPFHLVVVAAAVTGLGGRSGRFSIPLMAAVTAVLCFSNLLVMNQYYVALVRNGDGVRWTDAFSPLVAWLYESKMPHMWTADWGIQETLNLMSEGELPVYDGNFAIRSFHEPAGREALMGMLSAEGGIWVAHSPPAEQWPGMSAALLTDAGSLGFDSERLQTIHDRNGRPIFEIFRFRRRQ